MAHLRQRSPNIPVSKRSTKRSITIADHKTSISLENEFWDSLKEISVERGMSLGSLVAAIDADRQHANLSSAIRIFVLQFYRHQFQTRTAPFGAPPGGTAINERAQI
jgi:predicted DNA-binding ribbon-helix-helix protein